MNMTKLKSKFNYLTIVFSLAFLFLLLATPVFATETTIYNNTSYTSGYSNSAGIRNGFVFNSGAYNTLTSLQIHFQTVLTSQDFDFIICEYTVTDHVYTCTNTVYTETVNVSTTRITDYNYYAIFDFADMGLDTNTDYYISFLNPITLTIKYTSVTNSEFKTVFNNTDYYLVNNLVGIVKADLISLPTTNYENFDDFGIGTVCGQGDFSCAGTYTSNIVTSNYSSSPNSLGVLTDSMFGSDYIQWDVPDLVTDEYYTMDILHQYLQGSVYLVAFYNSSSALHTFFSIQDGGTLYINGQDSHRYILNSDFNNYEIDIDGENDCAKMRVNQSTWSNCKSYGVSDNQTTFVRLYSTDSSGDISYIDNLGTIESSPDPDPADVSANLLTWFYPQDGYVVSNADVNDWGIYYDLVDTEVYDEMLLRIYYQDGLELYVDQELIATSTDLTYWTMNRSNYMVDGSVTAYGEIIGTLDGVAYSVGSLPSITFIASSTGETIFDYGRVGYFPATTTIDVDSDWIGSFIKDTVMNIFPIGTALTLQDTFYKARDYKRKYADNTDYQITLNDFIMDDYQLETDAPLLLSSMVEDNLPIWSTHVYPWMGYLLYVATFLYILTNLLGISYLPRFSMGKSSAKQSTGDAMQSTPYTRGIN